MAVLIGETKTRFYNGEKYTFERVALGEWKQIEGSSSSMIPYTILDEIKGWK